MRRIVFHVIIFACTILLHANESFAQGMHFSQYYNAPLLLNPANAALMSDNDYRVGVNYRNQWASVPVPYKTLSAYGDAQLMKHGNASNWMGLGFAFFNDKAGNGDLTLSRFDASVAYHVMMGDYSMVSVGLQGGYAQRSVNFNKLTFNQQWDGFRFDIDMPNGEKDGTINTNYFDVGAGVNLAFFPNELTYIKFGAGLAHINQPKETFFNNSYVNQVGVRPTANIDALFIMNESFTLNPSVYYTMQRSSYELLFGSLGNIKVGRGDKDVATQLIVGVFYRWNEAAVGAFGLQWGGMKLMASYDYTVSSLAVDNKGNGATELSISYQGIYGDMGGSRRTINCPRF